jgi:hypothetical protein
MAAGAVLGALALLSAAAVPAQARTAPTQGTVIASNTGTSSPVHVVVSVPASEAKSAVAAAQVRSALDKQLTAAVSTSSPQVSIPPVVSADLYCSHAYSFALSLNLPPLPVDIGTLSILHNCGATTTNWGWHFSRALCLLALEPPDGKNMTEKGLAWTRNGKKQSPQSGHFEGCFYQFHGTFNPDHDNDKITFSDTYTFQLELPGRVYVVNINIYGNFVSLGCKNALTCGARG